MYVSCTSITFSPVFTLLSTYAGVRTKADIIFEAVVPWVPQIILHAAFALPTEAFKALQHNRSVSARVSAELVTSQVEAVSMGNLTGKDLLNVMGEFFFFLFKSAS